MTTDKSRNAAARELAESYPQRIADAALSSFMLEKALEEWTSPEFRTLLSIDPTDDRVRREEAAASGLWRAAVARNLLFVRRFVAIMGPDKVQDFDAAENAQDLCMHLDKLPGPDDDGYVPSLLALVVEERVPNCARNRHDQRIMPSRIALSPEGDPRGERQLFLSPAAVARSTNSLPTLPGMGYGQEMGQPHLPLPLYRLGMDSQHGGGAPVALRLWVEGILGAQRSGMTRDIYSMTWGDLLRALWPNSHPRPAENLRKLEQAAGALNSPEAMVPWEDPKTGKGGRRLVVSLLDLPRDETRLEDMVTIAVHLPPGAGPGPTLPAVLGAWGARSAYAYAGLINLAFAWFNPGRTVVPAPGKRSGHWLQVNDPKRYPDLTDQDLLDLFVPVGGRNVTRRNALGRVRNTINQLRTAGLLRVSERKLLPPAPETPQTSPRARRRKRAENLPGAV